MSITIKATYENGILQPDGPLPLNDREQVTLVVTRAGSRIRSAVERYRMAVPEETARLIAEDPELRIGCSE